MKHQTVSTSTTPIIHPNNNLFLENETQQLHNLESCHQQSFSNAVLTNTNSSMKQSHTRIGKYSTDYCTIKSNTIGQ